MNDLSNVQKFVVDFAPVVYSCYKMEVVVLVGTAKIAYTGTGPQGLQGFELGFLQSFWSLQSLCSPLIHVL